MSDPIPWKFLRNAEGHTEHRPYVTTSGLAVDPAGNFPILYRSDKVRSAKNCWSLPSGLHEIGLTLEDQFAAELREELNLEVDPSCKTAKVGVYENIAACDGYHWVIILLVTRVKTLETLVNREPDKHSEIRIVNFNQLTTSEFLGLTWAPGLGDALKSYKDALRFEARFMSNEDARVNFALQQLNAGAGMKLS